MVMKFGDHVNILNENRLAQFVFDDAFRDEIRTAYLTKDMRQFDVKVMTMAGLVLTSTFTAGALVQVINQNWVKSITRDNAARLC